MATISITVRGKLYADLRPFAFNCLIDDERAINAKILLTGFRPALVSKITNGNVHFCYCLEKPSPSSFKIYVAGMNPSLVGH